VAGFFILLAVAQSYPLVLDLAGSVPGRGAGDNVTFVWNLWWFRTAVADPRLALFWTPHQFAPFGTSLVLNTNTTLEASAAAPLVPWLGLVAAHNVVLLAGLAANGFVLYALGWYSGASRAAAILAGVIFAGSSYIAIHLLGHFNLVQAWVIPVAALAWMAYIAWPTRRGAALVGLAFAAATYTDYYYLVFSGMFAVAWVVLLRPFRVRWVRGTLPRLSRALLILIGALVVVAIAIVATGGFRLQLAGLPISASHVRNPVAAIWLLTILWSLLHVRFVRTLPGRGGVTGEGEKGRFQQEKERKGVKTQDFSPSPLLLLKPPLLAWLASIALPIYAAIVMPLAAAAVRLILAGEYVAPASHWRSGPRGIDVATMVLGNPLHPFYGESVRRVYDRIGVDVMEEVAWIGLAPVVVLLIAAFKRPRLDALSRRWLWIGGLFLLWSAGPFLIVAGADVGLPMPQALARFVPILSNARMPGRAIVVVQLAAAVLTARLATQMKWRAGTIVAFVVLAVVDSTVVPFPVYELPRSGSIEAHIRMNPTAGSVLELPAGVRDGFGAIGHMDHRAFVFQWAHERPLVGGAISRLASRVTDGYLSHPALMSMILWPERQLPPDLVHQLRSAEVRYVVVNTDLIGEPISPELRDRGLRLLAIDGPRELYGVD
jgi:hypothetical protein